MEAENLHHIQENIVLLSLLNREPSGPARTNLEDYASRQPQQDTSTRCLPLNREYEIAECLAFLSGTTDEPKRVTALCIEENAGGSSLTIRIATNSGVNDQFLEELQAMACVLQEASNCVRPEERQRMIGQAIITLARERFLSRLRSRHARPSLRNRGRPAVTSRLAKETTSLVIDDSEYSISFQERTRVLQTLFARLETFATANVRDGGADGVLLDLMLEFSLFPPQKVLEEAFKRVDNSTTCLSDTASLVIAIAKLRRYWTTCEFLSIAVRRYSLFRDVKIARIEAELPFISTASLPAGDYFQKLLLRLNQRDILKGSADKFCNQRLDCSLQMAGKRFLDSMKNLHPRVHAEIQLLMFYESRPDFQWPRVISSSKSACFLCNLLVTHHGRFYMGRTHGVLYPNWTMPVDSLTRFSGSQLLRICQVLKKFAFDIEKALGSTIKLKVKRSHPNESVADFPVCWTPSLISSSHGPPSHVISELSPEKESINPQGKIPKKMFDHNDGPPSISLSVLGGKEEQSDEENVTYVSDHVILQFSPDVGPNTMQSDASHPSISSKSVQSCQMMVSYSNIPIYLQLGESISIRCRASYNIVVMAHRMVLELSGEALADAGSRCGDTKTITFMLSTSANIHVPDDNVIDLRAMELGEIKEIELREEFNDFSLFIGTGMYMKYEENTVAILLSQ